PIAHHNLSIRVKNFTGSAVSTGTAANIASNELMDWRRGWDSHPDRALKTKNLRHSRFLTIRQIRQKTEGEARIEHAACCLQKIAYTRRSRCLTPLGRSSDQHSSEIARRHPCWSCDSRCRHHDGHAGSPRSLSV